MKKVLLIISLAIFVCNVFAASKKPDGYKYPFLGVDTAGVHLLRNAGYGKQGWYFPVFGKTLNELGVDYIVDHYYELAPYNEAYGNKEVSKSMLLDLVAFLEENNLNYVMNLERANWRESFEYNKGENFFVHDEQLHYFKLPDDIMQIFKDNERLLGVCYDELEHMQINNNRFISRGDNGANGDIPALADTTGMDFTQAYESIYKKAVELRDYHAQYGASCKVELVWPVMHHIFARAGWVISPKILKESWNPVVFAMALGAAVQYEDNGCDVHINPDLWFCGHYPGHSSQSLKSALIAAHWIGASNVYVENLDYVNIVNPIHDPVKAKGFDYSTALQGRHHPDAKGIYGSLVSYIDAENFELTKYGEVVKWYNEYRFDNPRDYSWRDVECKIAIIRFPDSCWGQDNSNFDDTLLGSKTLQSTPETKAWFKIWNILTKGTIPDTGISFHSNYIKPQQIVEGMQWGPRFFCPIPPVLVFDHRIGDERPEFDFKGAEVLFLTGVNITPATRHLVKSYVKSGKTCISLPQLAPYSIRKQYDVDLGGSQVILDGTGKWLLTPDFGDSAVMKLVEEYLPADDEMQYIFNGKEVVLKMMDNNPDKIDVIFR